MICQDCKLNTAVYECTNCKTLICAPCAKGEMLYHNCTNTKTTNAKFLN